MADKKNLLDSELTNVTGGKNHGGLLKNIGQVLSGTTVSGQTQNTSISGSVSGNGINVTFGSVSQNAAGSVSGNSVKK